MIVEFNKHFLKDLDKINQVSIKKDISEIITAVTQASIPSEIKNLKKLKGHSSAYRIRSGDYRIGIFIENNVVEFNRIG